MSTTTTLNALTEGRCPDFLARITELDSRPVTVTTAEGKPIVIFHMVVTDITMSMQVTAWDSAHMFHTLTLGRVFSFTGLTAKPVKLGSVFRDFGDMALNFGKQSRASVPSLRFTEADFPPTPTRVSTRVNASSTANTPVKRPRETTPCCATPHAPFCCQTGRPHKARCDMCNNTTDSSPFCALTGLPHI